MIRKKDLIQKSLAHLAHLKETVTAVLPRRAREVLAVAWRHIQDRYDQLVDALEPDTANDPVGPLGDPDRRGPRHGPDRTLFADCRGVRP